MQVDAILIDQAEFGERARQVGPRNLELPFALGFQLALCTLEIRAKERRVGAVAVSPGRYDDK
jgi:hypothetical protein